MCLSLPWNVSGDVMEEFGEGILSRTVIHGSPLVVESPSGGEGCQLVAPGIKRDLVVPGVNIHYHFEIMVQNTCDEVKGGPGVVDLMQASLV